jgi:hypothetical protein
MFLTEELEFPFYLFSAVCILVPIISKMGMSYSTTKWVAPVSFVIDFAAQQYGVFAAPNMKDIHYAYLSFFSPQPLFIAAFFFPQQLFQLGWLYRLYRLDPTKSNAERQRARPTGGFRSILLRWESLHCRYADALSAMCLWSCS